ncbi:DNA ligase D [Mucilaginibacter arboris]|uniref:DNA ligase (ATP) n=1 Tax=Mucilaginibacter arboris TaxID=2682090 RepID=A0A7K1SVN9_9SPHI|nr:DNA ligase D [Mucilaginibacter arboris]MVN21409.1 DNA ligase D [Mucilaginibacter arboris]
MTLEKYNSKRKFDKTPEPTAGKNPGKELRFVVQRHHASHLHYDFRLELDGVLKSWAVPKGPSLNPKDRRLAMMVEDHPYDYRTFEGEIPKGNYGAGVVTIFDEGTYQSLAADRKDDVKELHKGLYSGNLKFRLNGKKLQGEFALVKIKEDEQNSWLLIKHRDEFATDEKFDAEQLVSEEVKTAGKKFKKGSAVVKAEPEKNPEPETKFPYSPMLAEPANTVFNDKNWVFERKLDGYRIIATTGKQVKLITRKGQDYTTTYPAIAEALEAVKDNAVLDGEITVEDPLGKEDFQSLQHFEKDDKQHILKYYVFDLLYLNGHGLQEMPLIQRKELLKKLLQKQQSNKVTYHEHVAEKGKEFFEQALKNNWEGIIAKKADSTYLIGKRSDAWLKFKQANSQEAIICGFTNPAGARKYFGALVLGLYDEDGTLQYMGNCGSGFNNQVLKELYEQMEALEISQKPFSKETIVAQEKSVTWIKPELVCEVNFTEWTEGVHLRHPVYKGLRIDKEARDVKREFANAVQEEKVEEENIEQMLLLAHKNLKLTHLDKLFWKNEKITKGELLYYYEQISGYILPYLKDKPLSLNRHPNGIDAPGFFQKDVNVEQMPGWIKTVPVYSESNQKEIDYLICNDVDSLIFTANLGCIEINPWLSSYKKPENPEFMVIDLDPDGNDFSEVKQVALTVKAVYDQMEIPSFVKTSGSTGIHIYIYLAAQYDYDFVKKFANYVAQLVHEQEQDITSLERSLDKRKGLIYIDFLQNRRGQTVAAPYSARPKPGATVSMPLFWEEVNDDLQIKNFNIKNVPRLLKNRHDPWKEIRTKKVDLLKVLKQSKAAT